MSAIQGTYRRPEREGPQLALPLKKAQLRKDSRSVLNFVDAMTFLMGPLKAENSSTWSLALGFIYLHPPLLWTGSICKNNVTLSKEKGAHA